MATALPPRDPTDDASNYTQPAATTQLTKFTATATAKSAEEAQALALAKANESATQQFGNNTTQFAGLDQVRVKIEGTAPPYTYSATYERNAYQVEPPAVSGLTPQEQNAFLLANEGPQGEAQLTREQQQFLEANGGFEPQPVSEPTREQQAFLEANGLPEPAPVEVTPNSLIEQQKFLEANTGPEATPIDPLEDAAEAERLAKQEKLNADSAANISLNPGPNQGTAGGVYDAQNSGNNNTSSETTALQDYRVRLSLAPASNYFYKAPGIKKSDLLYPLIATNGIIFPYTPSISVTYSANYEPAELTHSNYKIYNYRSSAVENLNITADFTCQDLFEANYVLAVIHFLRSATKMFYGKDQNPVKGIPPPLVYLTGHGTYGFDQHPAVINSFTLTYPTDVDYIDAGPQTAEINYLPPTYNRSTTSQRLSASKLRAGGLAPTPVFTLSAKQPPVTRIPTKLQIQLGLYPIITRYNMSNKFSLKEYATGQLLRGSLNPNGGGIW